MEIEDLYALYSKSHDVVIDSRKVQKGDLFFAFSGENYDAAKEADNAINGGAIAVIVENASYAKPDKSIYYFPSTLEILQKLCCFHRSRLNIPVIGLTGSNGKTTTKELIYSVLEKKFRVQYTKGNLNNHIGVPLSILSIRPEHEIAVIEMGANHQKEIELLCSFSQPDFGYITNFGKAHLEGFGGVEGVIKGKSELYDFLINHDKTILVNEGDPIQVEKTKNYTHKISFGADHSDYQFGMFADGHHIGISFGKQKALSQLTGDYNYTNLCAAVAFGLYFSVDQAQIKAALENYAPTNMRSQIVLKEGRTLVLDTYNANPSSMEAALKNFSKYEGSKTIVIGDMFELGACSEDEHKKILNLAKHLNFEKIITVGPRFKNENSTSLSFASIQEVQDYLQENPIKTENILLKGSRGMALENLLDFI